MSTSIRKTFLGTAALFFAVATALPLAASAGMTMGHKKAAVHKAAAHKVAAGSAHVKAIQKALDKSGAKLKVDGLMGKQTEAALRAYQKKHGLKVTGTADKATLKSLGVK